MRDLLTAVLDELDTDQVRLAVLGEFEFNSGTVNLWAGPLGKSISYDSKTWTGIGEIGRIDKLAEAQGLADSTTTVSLHINSDNVDIVEVEDSRGNKATITLLVLSDEGAIIGGMDFVYTMGGCRVEAEVETDEYGGKIINERLLLDLHAETYTLEQTYFVRNTYAAGQRIMATDHGLEFVADPEISKIGYVGTPGSPRPPNRFERQR